MPDAHAQTPHSRDEISGEVRKQVATLFNLPIDMVTDETIVDDIDGWDSTSHVGLILQIEDSIGIQFDIEKITAFGNVGELIDECVRLANENERT